MDRADRRAATEGARGARARRHRSAYALLDALEDAGFRVEVFDGVYDWRAHGDGPMPRGRIVAVDLDLTG